MLARYTGWLATPGGTLPLNSDLRLEVADPYRTKAIPLQKSTRPIAPEKRHFLSLYLSMPASIRFVFRTEHHRLRISEADTARDNVQSFGISRTTFGLCEPTSASG
jgi:hypothetical protein